MSKIYSMCAHRAAIFRCALVAFLLSVAPVTLASELRATKDFADVAAVVDRYVEEFGAEHVLLVLDIDNTIMAMDTDLGSDHWFEWQNYLLKNEPDSKFLVAKTFEGLLEVQGILYNLDHMHPPQPETPAIIAGLQQVGIVTILLTSRGPEFRVYTERELKRCGYDFAATALPVRDVPSGPYLAYDLAKPEKDGLTPAEIVRLKLPEPRPASYANGVFMTAGQHKGIMLLTLLNDSPRDIRAVVFVDDNVRHVGSVFSSAVDRNLEITVFQYQQEDLRAQRFAYSDKREVTERWQKLKRSIDQSLAEKPRLHKPAREPASKCKRCPPRRRFWLSF
jgi:hypothetical protein